MGNNVGNWLSAGKLARHLAVHRLRVLIQLCLTSRESIVVPQPQWSRAWCVWLEQFLEPDSPSSDIGSTTYYLYDVGQVNSSVCSSAFFIFKLWWYYYHLQKDMRGIKYSKQYLAHGEWLSKLSPLFNVCGCVFKLLISFIMVLKWVPHLHKFFDIAAIERQRFYVSSPWMWAGSQALWLTEHSRRDSGWLLSLGDKRLCDFCLVSWNTLTWSPEPCEGHWGVMKPCHLEKPLQAPQQSWSSGCPSPGSARWVKEPSGNFSPSSQVTPDI